MKPEKFLYNLDELEKRWREYDISKNDILRNAVLKEFPFSVYFDGLTSYQKKSVRFFDTPSHIYKGIVYLCISESDAMILLANTKKSFPFFYNDNGKKVIRYSATHPYEYRGKNEHGLADLLLEYQYVEILDELFKTQNSQFKIDQSVCNRTTSTSQTPTPENKKRGGAPQKPLRTAVTFLYNMCIQNGDIEILKPGKIHKFLLKFQETQKIPPSIPAQIAFEDINEVKKVSGKWLIKVPERTLKDTDVRELTEKPRNYLQNDVAKILTDLRKTKPLPD